MANPSTTVAACAHTCDGIKTYALDFEVDYVKGRRDITSLGAIPYLRHRETVIYLVAIYGLDVQYSGPVEGAPWFQIDGHQWVSHNAAFDAAAFIEACRRGKVPVLPSGTFPLPDEWDCTANLCAYLAIPRALDGAVRELFGVTLDKTTRDRMNGKKCGEMTPAFQAECKNYAQSDARYCWKIWDECHAKWPPTEIALSRHTTEMTLRGIGVDLARVLKSIAVLETALSAIKARIPWANTPNAKGRYTPVTSLPALRAECVKRGLPPPSTTEEKSPIFAEWLEQHADRADFVRAVAEYRSVNRTQKLLQKLQQQVGADGRFLYSLKYFGACTGRWSGGGGGFNIQNLNKEKVAGVDVRNCFVPAPGKKFIVADLSQIEARVVLWFAEDWVQLKLIRDGMDLYEAHARQTMSYNDPRKLKEYVADSNTPEAARKIRDNAKVRVLGLGYGMGAATFVSYVQSQLKRTITFEEAKEIVRDFRAKNPGIVKTWYEIDDAMHHHVRRNDREPYSIILPSGRAIQYFDLRRTPDGLTARMQRGGYETSVWGGIGFNNLCQGTARDILGSAILAIEAAGYPVVLHVHDEVVVEVPLDVPVSAIRDLMCVTPTWMEGLPLACDAKEMMYYQKG